jgi:hypothetical protein
MMEDPPPHDGACSLSALPLALVEMVVERIEPEFRHAMRATCRTARAAVNASARTLVLTHHPALRRPRDQPAPPAVAAALRAMFPNISTLVLSAQHKDQVAAVLQGGGDGAAEVTSGGAKQPTEAQLEPRSSFPGFSLQKPTVTLAAMSTSPGSSSSSSSLGGAAAGQAAGQAAAAAHGGGSTALACASALRRSASRSSSLGSCGDDASSEGSASALKSSYLSLKSAASSSYLTSDGSCYTCGGFQPSCCGCSSSTGADSEGGELDDCGGALFSFSLGARPNAWSGLTRVVFSFDALTGRWIL